MSVERYTNAYSRTSGHNPIFIDDEAPTGTKDGANLTFTLAYAPVGDSLRLYLNGTFLIPGTDFTVSDKTITLDAGSAPISSDTLTAYYRA